MTVAQKRASEARGEIGRWIWLRKSDLFPEDLERLRVVAVPKKLTSYGKAEPVSVKLYTEVDDMIGLPRFANCWNTIEDLPDRRIFNRPVSFSKTPILPKNVEQARLMDEVYALAETKNPGCLLVADGAFGKTVVALEVIRRLGQRALILVNTETLVQQWISKIKEFLKLPDDQIGLVRGQVCQYDRPISVGTYQSIMRLEKYGREFEEAFAVIVGDEIAVASAPVFSQAMPRFPAFFRLGLSVGGDSRVLVKCCDGNIRYLTLEELYESSWKNHSLWARSLSGNHFVWSFVDAVIKHPLGRKKVYRVYLEKGISLLISGDHSVYRIKPNEFQYVQGHRKPIAKLEEVRGKDLRLGDYLLLEDSCNLPDGSLISGFHVPEYLPTNARWYVANPKYRSLLKGLLSSLTGRLIRSRRYRCQHGRYGPFISGKEYLDRPEFQSCSQKQCRVYTGGAHGNWLASIIPTSSIAYLLGFYLGDGYFTENRIGFSVADYQLDDFLNRISTSILKHSKCGIYIRKAHGRSFDVRVSNWPLARLFRALTSGAKAHNKRIPIEVFRFSGEQIREFLMGMLESDGHLSTLKPRWYYTTVSKRLAEDLQELLKRINVQASISSTRLAGALGGIVRGSQIINRHATHVVHFSNHAFVGDNSGRKGRRFPFIMKGLPGHPVKILKITTNERPAYVYDIAVSGDGSPTFVASSVLVHNSGTPNRRDGMDIVFRSHLGPVVTTSARTSVSPLVYSIPYRTGLYERDFYNRWDGKLNLSRLINALAEDERRTALIARLIEKSWRAGRRTMALTDRREHAVDIIFKLVEYGVPEIEVGLVRGAMKKSEDRNGQMGRKVLIATYKACEVGTDIPDLECLLLATPRADVTQAIWRLVREHPGKRQPVLLDIVDDLPVLNNFFRARMDRVYRKLNYEVRQPTYEQKSSKRSEDSS